MTAQIFNLEEHWPNGILLWAIAALAGWLLLRDWPQAAMLANLAPAWLASEWAVRTENTYGGARIMLAGLTCLALAYFTVDRDKRDSGARERWCASAGWRFCLGSRYLVAVNSAPVNSEAFPRNQAAPLSMGAELIGRILRWVCRWRLRFTRAANERG